MYESTEKPNIEEQYQTAGNTSDLTVEADRRGAGDVLIAAGWSPSRVGMALLRLHSEWDSAAKPKRPNKAAVEAIAATIRAEDQEERDNRAKANGELARLRASLGRKDMTAERAFEVMVEIMKLEKLYAKGALPLPEVRRGNVAERAQKRAADWYASELRLLATGLKSRPVAWTQLSQWLAVKGIHADTVAAALLHWLDPSCRVCDGRGLRKVPDQPALSARQCHKCHGTGHVPHPQGSAQVLGHLDYCVQAARQSLKARLRQGD